MSHYDPRARRHDEYRFAWKDKGRYIMVSTHAIDSAGDIWLSMLTTGGLGKFDRKTNSIVWWDVPILRSRPYGITLDRDDNVWIAEYHNNGLARFDPKSGSFRHYPLTVQAQTSIRRPGVDSRNFVWAGTYGSYAGRNAAIYRLDPRTGAVEEHKVGIPYANPYDVEPDTEDNIWVATDNHVLKFDQRTGRFTNYPVTTRTDIPKLAVTRDGAVWFAPRNAGQSGGYGGAVAVLFPDKDGIESFAAHYAKDHPRNRRASHEWPATEVKGRTILVPPAPQNPCEFANAVGLPSACVDAAKVPSSSGAIEGGAARE
jgi:streptogramin lyase